MYRRDYNPNRFEVCKEAIVNLVRTRRSDDQKTSFALITFGTDIKTVLNFHDYCDAETMQSILSDVELGGNSKLADALGMAIKLHIEELRKAGAKVPKILVLSDGNITKSSVEPSKMAEIAKGLEIKIDTIRLGEVEHFNILKRISELSDGKYYYCPMVNDVLSTAIIIAESNKGKRYQKTKNYGKILEKIAAPLMTLGELDKNAADIAARIRGTASFKKCGICFQDKDPVTQIGFNISGRYCPNCGQGFHIHCLSGWASNDPDNTGNIARCPHCFYLLKIPSEIQQVTKIREDFKRTIKESDLSKDRVFYARKYIAYELGDTAIYNACPVCNTIFDENEEVIKCGNPECNAVYHIDCAKSVYNNPCKICGYKVGNPFI